MWAKLQEPIAAARAALAALDAARSEYSAAGYLRAARLYPSEPLPDVTGTLVDTFENAAERRHRLAVEARNAVLERIAESMQRRELRDELRESDAAELADKLRRLDLNTESGAAELYAIEREIARRDATTHATVRPALDDARARLKLPDAIARGAAIIAELDWLAPLFEASADAVRSGDETHARNLERAHHVVDKAGALAAVDREQFAAFRTAEDRADADAAQKLSTEIVQAAALDLTSTATPPPA